MTGTVCPACGGTDLSSIYRVDDVPVQSCILLDTEEEARAFPRADIELLFCATCGFIFNALFEPGLVDYAAATEESQHFSGTFNRFAARLVEEIAASRDLAGKQILEIGCGKGDFLHALVERTGASALGVDPGFIPDRAMNGHPIRFRKEFFHPEGIDVRPDLVICRHTLEHIPAVSEFIADIACVLDRPDGVELFFETPDVQRVIVEGAFWDIYYEHCSYFSCGTHARLFRRHGMNVTRLYLDFAEQYIIQFAETGRGDAPLACERDLAELRRLMKDFPDRVSASRAGWAEFVRSRHRAGKRVCLWGGGSKAVSFLTTNALSEEVSDVVDVNPYKQGKFLPGAGHEVRAPERLREATPDTVIVLNPVYREEIGAALTQMGIDAELVALS